MFSYIIQACSGPDDAGNIRLVDGTSIQEGRLEVCSNGKWMTVCDSNFNVADALVVCRQLGLSTPSTSVLISRSSLVICGQLSFMTQPIHTCTENT